MIVSLSQPFSGFRFCVINHVSAPKLLSLISVTYPMDTRKAHTLPCSELRHHLWDSLTPSVHTLLCNPIGPGQFCALPSKCLALWQCQQMNMSVGHASSVVDMLGVQVNIHPDTVQSHAPYLPVFMVLHITHKNQNTLHTSKYAMVLADHPSLMTYLLYPLIAVQWHNLHLAITCLYLQSHDTISCQTCCYLIFWNLLVYLSEAENSKYGTKKHPQQGVQLEWIRTYHSFWTLIMPLVWLMRQ